MTKLLFLILLVVPLPPDGVCQDMIRGHYCYTCQEGQGIQEARELTRTLALRNAIESWKGFSEALGPSGDYRLTGDIVQIIASGYMADFRVVEHTEEGRKVCETVEARVSAEQLSEVVRREVSRREREIEESGVDNNGCLKILRTAKQSDRYGSRVMAVVKVLRPTGSLYLPSQRDAKPCFKVIVDSFDPDGSPLGSHAMFVHESEEGMSPGETKALFFPLQRDAKSFKAWLVGGISSPAKALAGKSRIKRQEARTVASRIDPTAVQDGQPGRRTLKGIVPGESGGELVVQIVADGPVHRYRKFFMDSPSRLVIDLEGEWAVTGSSSVEVQNGTVARIRIGKHETKLRIVLDLKESAPVRSAAITPSPEGLTVALGRD